MYKKNFKIYFLMFLSFSLLASSISSFSLSAQADPSSAKHWSESLSMNEADAAYMNANVRYYNAGTAPVYDARPTVNFALGADTFATIQMKENNIAQALPPNSIYPDLSQNGMAVLAQDDFGSTPIRMNKNQVDSLNGSDPQQLKTQTIQYGGGLGVIVLEVRNLCMMGNGLTL